MLDKLYTLGVADDFLLLLDDNLGFGAEVRTIKVIDTVKVVEVSQGSVASPVIEGGEATNG